jgi:hypothetical protein
MAKASCTPPLAHGVGGGAGLQAGVAQHVGDGFGGALLLGVVGGGGFTGSLFLSPVCFHFGQDFGYVVLGCGAAAQAHVLHSLHRVGCGASEPMDL